MHSSFGFRTVPCVQKRLFFLVFRIQTLGDDAILSTGENKILPGFAIPKQNSLQREKNPQTTLKMQKWDHTLIRQRVVQNPIRSRRFLQVSVAFEI
jgi:hypothetical protein